jgi:4-alpha-glucanotransferase
MATDPLLFLFGIHIHQPVGNFDHVVRDHVDAVYLPLLRRLADRDLLPAALHLSGPLLDWMERNDRAFLDLTGRLVAEGRLELLLSGFDEPVLAALSRDDRLEQVVRMRDALRRHFGVDGETLWLTERVWEPDLPADLARAGVKSVLVDDRHFLVSGFRREALHAPFRTEADGRSVALFPIDERLRYLVPFQPPEDTAHYLRRLRAGGARMAVLADDGEKFGGWPGTLEWVWEQGWMDRYVETMSQLVHDGEIRLSTPSAALEALPSAGLAYLPSASYSEMEGWALPPDGARRLQRIEVEMGEERMRGPDGSLVRGSHWRNFLVRYPESNRMHKKMMALSSLSRRKGDPPDARRAIGRAQCNDAYWHGVFGGLYLKHLRDAVWANLARAEGILREGEPLRHEWKDVDGDGHLEIVVNSGHFSAVVSPRRGGGLEEYTVFRTGVNQAAVLTRRMEAYHLPSAREGAAHGEDRGPAPENAEPHHDVPGTSADRASSAPSIHHLERAMRPDERPPLDHEDRALFLDRVLPGDLALEQYRTGRYEPLKSWATTPLRASVATPAGAVEITLVDPAGGLEKRYRFDPRGGLIVSYRWDTSAFPADARFAPEVSVAGALTLRSAPVVDSWVHPVTTVSKSERGLDETPQGTSETLLFPVALGGGRIDAGVG